MEDLEKYPDSFFGHSHPTHYSDTILHNDYHVKDEFHVHVTGMLPETGKVYLKYIHGTVFCYFSFVVVLVVYHVSCRPRIDNSRRQYRC